MTGRQRLAVRGGSVDRRVGGAVQVAIETRALARVTRRAGGLHERDQCVAVAVVADLPNSLYVAGCLPLAPELVPRAAVEVHLTALERPAERLVAHVGERQHLTGRPVLHHAGHEPTLVEVNRVEWFRRRHLQEFTVGVPSVWPLTGHIREKTANAASRRWVAWRPPALPSLPPYVAV